MKRLHLTHGPAGDGATGAQRDARLGVALSILVGFLIGFTPARSADPPAQIIWEEEHLSLTIGDGSSSAGPVSVIFHTTVDVQSPQIFISDDLRQFVEVSSSPSGLIAKGSQNELQLSLRIPQNTPEGAYTGTVHVREGRKTLPTVLKLTVVVDYNGIIVSPYTRVLSHETAVLLTDAGPDSLVFSKATTELLSLTPGHFLVIEPTPSEPLGVIAEVLGVQIENGELTVHIGPASLSDLFIQADISFSKFLVPELLAEAPELVPGVSFGVQQLKAAKALAADGAFQITLAEVPFEGELGAIEASGSLAIRSSIHFDLEVSGSNLKSMEFSQDITSGGELTVSSSADFSNEVSRDIAKFKFRAFVLWAGWVPIILRPELVIEIGAEGQVSGSIEAGVSHQTIITTGVRFDESSGWEPFSGLEQHFEAQGPEVSASATLRAYAGPKLFLWIYGAVGPFAGIQGALVLDADINRVPFWQLSALIDCLIGIEVEIFDEALVDETFSLNKFLLVLAEGGGRRTRVVVSQESAPGAADFNNHRLGEVEAFTASGKSAADEYGFDRDGNWSYNGQVGQVSDMTQLFFVNTSEGLTLFTLHDAEFDGSGGRIELNYALSPEASSATVLVQDDPTTRDSDDRYCTSASGPPCAVDPGVIGTRHRWNQNRTDGSVIGPLEGDSWAIYVSLDDVDGDGVATLLGIAGWQATGADGTPAVGLVLEEGRRVRLRPVFE